MHNVHLHFGVFAGIFCFLLILSRRKSLSYRKQFIDLQCKLVNWFLFHRNLCHERIIVLYGISWNICICLFQGTDCISNNKYDAGKKVNCHSESQTYLRKIDWNKYPLQHYANEFLGFQRQICLRKSLLLFGRFGKVSVSFYIVYSFQFDRIPLST